MCLRLMFPGVFIHRFARVEEHDKKQMVKQEGAKCREYNIHTRIEGYIFGDAHMDFAGARASECLASAHKEWESYSMSANQGLKQWMGV